MFLDGLSLAALAREIIVKNLFVKARWHSSILFGSQIMSEEASGPAAAC